MRRVVLNRSAGSRAAGRRGITSFELVAAFSLLVAAMASTLPLYVRHQRLLSESRRERVAMEELANQAERITAAGAGVDVASLVVSETAQRRLPGVALSATRDRTSLGERVLLSLSWADTGRTEHPLRLAVWLPAADLAGAEPEGQP